MFGLGLLQYYGRGSLLFYFHSQEQHNKLEHDRVNQSEGRLSTSRSPLLCERGKKGLTVFNAGAVTN
jgi:hypothetical protein